MKLSELADALERLEATRSRLRIAEHVADLLARCARDERAAVVYLLQARLRPDYEGIELGLGEKLPVRALAQAYAVGDAAVRRRFRSYGDLGRVAESLAPAVTRQRMSVRRAYDTLIGVARTSGVDSLQRKISQVADLLHVLGPREAKLVVRIVQGKLRLGLGDQTILEAAALGALGDRRKKGLLEQAYNVRSDLGEVVSLAFVRGERSLARIGPRIGPRIGVPVRPALGSLVGAVYDEKHDRFRTVAKIGSGLSDAGWKELRAQLDADAVKSRPTRVDASISADVWVEPRYVVEVLADEITRSPTHTCGKSGRSPGYALRFPRMLSVRTDKSATDATTEREIVSMYKQQRK